MAKISNTEVQYLSDSIFASGYPMMDEAPEQSEICQTELGIERYILNRSKNNYESHIKRATYLANAKGGGHDQFLTGIVVQFDMTFSQKAWVEAERYTFLNFVSSMSTMHRIKNFNIGTMCNEYVMPEAIALLERLQKEYNEASPENKKEAQLRLLYNTPSGFELTARMVTNYRCLKNIYEQRRHHKLPDWQVFCDWVEKLPYAKELITGGR